MISYTTQGVCSTEISFDIDNGVLKHVHFTGGCQGNLLAISKLVEGMPVKDVVLKLRGIPCEENLTSCADQLARALEQYSK